MADRQHLDRMARDLADHGKLIEAGWYSLRLQCIPDDAPPYQLNMMRMAFFAGAQHLFGSLAAIMEQDIEPSDTDLQRMDLINNELNEFLKDFSISMSMIKTKGSA